MYKTFLPSLSSPSASDLIRAAGDSLTAAATPRSALFGRPLGHPECSNFIDLSMAFGRSHDKHEISDFLGRYCFPGPRNGACWRYRRFLPGSAVGTRSQPHRRRPTGAPITQGHQGAHFCCCSRKKDEQKNAEVLCSRVQAFSVCYFCFLVHRNF